MNSKQDETEMEQVQKNRLLPRLRFPEFRDAPAWDIVLFREVYKFMATNSLSRDKLNYVNGSVKNIHYGDIHTKFSTLFDIENETVPYINFSEIPEKINPEIYCKEGDIIFADASEDLEDIGKSIEIVNLKTEKVLSGLHTLLARQKDKKITVGFGGYLFKSDRMRLSIQKVAQGTKVLGISAGRLSGISICFPIDKREQQKIADCLSSLDALIATQSQKLDALKAHKKGLLQDLFPIEGQTLPRLRFPEFRDAPAWEERRLSDVCERIMDGTHFSPKSKSGPRMYITSKNIQNGIIDFSNVSFISEEEHRQIFNKCPIKKNDVLLTKDGANTGNCAINNIDVEFSLLSSVAALRGNPQILEQRFLYQSILSDKTQRLIRESMSGQAITRITLDKIGNFAISITSVEEQQKIADCLSFLDDLIAAQSRKLDALKAHKKGLLQNLFPSVEEVTA